MEHDAPCVNCTVCVPSANMLQMDVMPPRWD
jgi:hypothetical protein